MIEPKTKHNFNRRNGAPVAALSVLILVVLACKSDINEMRPGWFEKPVRVENHGRIVEKRYNYYNGPRTHNYGILEVDGVPIDIPGAAVNYTTYCKVKGIEAVGFNARGKNPGSYVLQLDGDKVILKRICEYHSSAGIWHDEVYSPPCVVNWDAKNKKLVDWKSHPRSKK